MNIVGSILIILMILVPGAFAAGPAFSGITANADTAETASTNPAGMTRLKRPTIYANALVFYTESESEITQQNTGAKGEISGDSWFVLPEIYYVHPIGDRWAVGIGPYGVAGLGTSYGDDWIGRYLLDEWSLSFVGIVPGAAYSVNDNLSIGASVSIMYSRYTLNKAVFNGPNTDDGSFELIADGWGYGGTLSLLYELSEHTRFGLVYRSAVSVSDEGDPDFSGLTPERQQILDDFGILDEKISFDTGIPQMVNFGVFHDFQNDWSFSLDLAWIDFSEFGFEEIQIGETDVTTAPSTYNDMWGATLGVNYVINPKWTARSGAFYMSSALDEEDRTAFNRMSEMWGVGFGAEYEFRKGKSVTFDVTYLQFGDGKFRTGDVPVVGNVEGEYTTNYALVFGVGVSL